MERKKKIISTANVFLASAMLLAEEPDLSPPAQIEPAIEPEHPVDVSPDTHTTSQPEIAEERPENSDLSDEVINENELLDPDFPEALDDIETLAPVLVVGEAINHEPAVFGAPLAENPLLEFTNPGTSVLSGRELRRKLGATLGETLASEPGISSSSYSPGVSRPVIRGFEGVRVRTLRDGLGTMDLSQDSPDHGVLIDTLMTEEIEIYRGPSSLLFGNSAMGGAINTRTRYIPGVADGEPVAATAIGGYGTQGDAYRFATAAELRSEHFAFGFSLSERSAGDISIPGRARTDQYDDLVNPRVFIPGIGTIPVPNPKGTLPNSFHESSSWSLGARLGSEDALSIGLSHHHFDTTYGLPYFYPGDETDFFGDYSIDAALDRTDLDFSYTPDPGIWLRLARLRLGVGDYEHDEIFEGKGPYEGQSSTDTAFQKEAFEGRLEFFHGEDDDPFSGIFGIHFVDEDVDVTRLLTPPPTLVEGRSSLDSETLGIFALEKWTKGPLSLQAGLRWDHGDVSLTDQLGDSLSENDSSFSQSLSASYEFTDLAPLDLLRTSLTVSHVERLPTAIERYAFYNSAALGRFLIGGDLDGDILDREESNGLEFTVDFEKENTRGSLSLFYYQFDNYVYLQDQRGVSFAPTAQYVQTSAEFYGLEASLTQTLIEGSEESGSLDLRIVGDVMRGLDTDRSDVPLPRIPAARLGMEFIWDHPRWSASLETRYVFSQDRTASFPTAELPTDSYLMVNASVNWLPLPENDDLQVSLRLNNILDVDARDHTSFRKDTAPLPGFGLSTEVRWSF